MAKPTPKQRDKEVKEQDKLNYGEEDISGHMPNPESDDNAAKPLEEYIGNEPAEELNIAKEIEKDEDQKEKAEDEE